MNFSEILTFVRQRIKKLPESPFLHTYIYIQSDHKKTPQLIFFLFEIRFQRAVHQIKGFKKYYKLDINYMIICMKYVKKIIHTYQILLGNVSK
jgi:hypothetical protein